MFPSEPLIEAGIYPNKGMLPRNAQKSWAAFQVGVSSPSENEGQVLDWFNTYEKDDLGRVHVTEEYIPVLQMGTLIVLLTMDEGDVFYETDEDEEDEEDD